MAAPPTNSADGNTPNMPGAPSGALTSTPSAPGTAPAGSAPDSTEAAGGNAAGRGGAGNEEASSGGFGGTTDADVGGGGNGGGATSDGAGGSGGVGGGGGAGGNLEPGEGGAGGIPGQGAGGSPEATETVHYYGRWNLLEDRAITVNSGSHVVTQFSGTGLSALFDVSSNQTPNPTLTWRIDDGEWEEAELAQSMPLAANLPAGTHDVLLMVRGLNENQNRWNPPLISSITFVGFELADGGSLEATPRPQRPKVEFLGDSITEGVALWTSRNGQNTACWRADARRAYPSLTAQTLGAEWRQVGFGRQGLLIGGNGGVPTANDAFNFFYAGVPRDDWQPDLVVINQGTNDGGASANDFAPAYGTFLDTIRSAYPDAKIAAMRPFNGAHAGEIEGEVNTRRNAGDERFFFIDTSGWLSNADYTDGVHPNEQGSQKAAEALASAIEAIGLP